MKSIIELNGTKAETLLSLSKAGFSIPMVYFFDVQQWKTASDIILGEISKKFSTSSLLAIRSSAKAEDNDNASLAGAFLSVLNVNARSSSEINNAINNVIDSFDNAIDNQVLVQPMISNVKMSGVVMTKVLDDGSPYYVINFDDSTGRTDSVTSGNSINKTVYIYNGVKDEDFDSKLLLLVLKLVRSLELIFLKTPLDIEFAIDEKENIQLLQVRKITTSNQWKDRINQLVSSRIGFLKNFVEILMKPRINLYGSTTLLGIMPDWNPAEMIGVVPHPLAMSLYRELITKRTWSIAREKMGYRTMPNVELMVSLFGRPYIDVRNSMNSFIPNGLSHSIANKLVDAYLERLKKDPHLHDKIEFDVVLTAFDFEFDKKYNERYKGLLKKEDLLVFKSLIRSLTKEAIENKQTSSLYQALKDINQLKRLQENMQIIELTDPFTLSDRINTLIGECINYGTIPFSIIARHGFIAELMLRSAVNRAAITSDRLIQFRRSIQTVAGKMSEDFYKVCIGELMREEFLKEYGHLRPSSYDILSPRYRERKDLFDGSPQKQNESETFCLTDPERSNLNILLAESGFDGIKADDLLLHAKKSIIGREYAKFIFTKHLSEILECIAKWGVLRGFKRSQMSMLTLLDIQNGLFAPLTDNVKDYYFQKIERAQEYYDVASSIKLNYLIRSPHDVHIVPMQRSLPNFVGNKVIECNIVFLSPYLKKIPNLIDKIILIEGADPGYDWIFARNIAGLVTKYGGANSHMAIRCAELNIPAAIGCGEQPFERILKAKKCLLDCQRQKLEPQTITSY